MLAIQSELICHCLHFLIFKSVVYSLEFTASMIETMLAVPIIKVKYKRVVFVIVWLRVK